MTVIEIFPFMFFVPGQWSRIKKMLFHAGIFIKWSFLYNSSSVVDLYFKKGIWIQLILSDPDPDPMVRAENF